MGTQQLLEKNESTETNRSNRDQAQLKAQQEVDDVRWRGYPETLKPCVQTEVPELKLTGMQYDANGQKTKFVSNSGEEFVPDANNPEIWHSTTNKVQPEGVRLNYDETTRTSKVADAATGNIVTTDANGVETTEYFGGGKTVRKTLKTDAQATEWYTLQDKTGTIRSMRVEDNKLQEYTDDKGVTYKLNGGMNTEKNGTLVPKFSAIGADGKPLSSEFTITADRTGNVMVRNLSKNDSDDDVCRRVRIDGAVVLSNGDGSSRVFRTADGTEIRKRNGITVIRNANGSEVDITSDFDRDEKLAMLQQGPKATQVLPPGYDSQKVFDKGSQHPAFSTWPPEAYENNKWFIEQVNYGGEDDFKAPMSKSPDGMLINDQLARPEFEDAGNYNYAILGRGCGYPQDVLEVSGGVLQVWHDRAIRTDRMNSDSYGDDPKDTKVIRMAGREADQLEAQRRVA